MSTLTNKKISETYKGLLKTEDETTLTATPKAITDGDGNNSGVLLDNAGNLKVNNTIEFGEIKSSGENVIVNKFVDEADGIENNDNDTSLPTSAAVKNYVDGQITAEDLDFSGNTGTGDVDLDSEVFSITGSNGITTTALDNTLDIDGSTLQTAIQTNANDISTNATNIASNATDIANNSTNISNNATDIANNTTAITNNTSSISTIGQSVATNTTNIATNATNIAGNTTDIATNAAAIATNVTEIANNASNISNNTTNISTNTTNIATNTNDIATNASNIATNETEIISNAGLIATNANDIASLQTDVGTKVSKSGDTMTGELDMSVNKITGLALPTQSKDAASKGYVDSIKQYVTLTGLVNNLASQGSGGYDFMEWTSNVTGTDQIPAIKMVQSLKLIKVSYVWLGATALSIGMGENVTFSFRKLNGAVSSQIGNYTSLGNLFQLNNSDNGTFANGTVTLSTPISISDGDIVACIGQEAGTVEPNNGELSITFLFEIS